MLDKILILDFGSQFTQLIARKLRGESVYCEIHPYHYSIDLIKQFAPKGIILSGGPSSVYDKDAFKCDESLFDLGLPILGICYGMQLISQHFGGRVQSSNKREYGKTMIDILNPVGIFKNFDTKKQHLIWMSHGDSVSEIPSSFETIASSDSTPFTAIANLDKQIYGIQFHPEVTHSINGLEMLRNFVFEVCKCQANWNMSDFIETSVKKIRETVGDKNVICGLSGGVDSSVAGVLINKAIGKQLKCIFINNGLLREGEAEQVQKTFAESYDIDLIYVDASERFLSKLKGIDDPETKRKIIGKEFVEIFDEEAQKIQNVGFLAQGTLYTDVIESTSVRGPSAVIKSHHNVGGLPEKMNLKLLEPFRELFKDEVREVGSKLNMPERVIHRQPFPGPGLAIRIIGDITKERLEILRKADLILQEEMRNAGLYRKIWQAFVVLLPSVKSVGVMGDFRTYENPCVIRAIESVDGMTANFFPMPYDVVEKISSRITNEVRGINRVTYDVTSKPPATIEWE